MLRRQLTFFEPNSYPVACAAIAYLDAAAPNYRSHVLSGRMQGWSRRDWNVIASNAGLTRISPETVVAAIEIVMRHYGA